MEKFRDVYNFFRGETSGATRVAGQGGGQAEGSGRPQRDISHLSPTEQARIERDRQLAAEADVRKRQKIEEKRQKGAESRRGSMMQSAG